MERIRKAAGATLAAAVLAAAMAVPALAFSPVPDEPDQPVPEQCVIGTPLAGYMPYALDGMAAASGYRRVSDVGDGIVRKYVSVDENWTVTCVTLSEDFAWRSTYSLLSDFPGAIHGYPATVSDGMVLSETDFAREWFPVDPEDVPDPPVPDPVVPDQMERACVETVPEGGWRA